MPPPALLEKRRILQLETLYEIGRECTDARTPSEVLQVVLSSAMGAFGAVGGLACLGIGYLIARGATDLWEARRGAVAPRSATATATI